jgi:hypothetical protein
MRDLSTRADHELVRGVSGNEVVCQLDTARRDINSRTVGLDGIVVDVNSILRVRDVNTRGTVFSEGVSADEEITRLASRRLNGDAIASVIAQRAATHFSGLHRPGRRSQNDSVGCALVDG